MTRSTLCSLALAAVALAPTTLHAGDVQLLDANGETGDAFGGGANLNFLGGPGVALDGDVLAVSSWADDIGPNNGQGSVTVYRNNGIAWVQEAELTKSDGGPGDAFGSSVAVSGDVIVVGAVLDAAGFSPEVGSATVFRYDGLNWNEEQILLENPGGIQHHFGTSVAVDGHVIAVGAPLASVGPLIQCGRVSVYRFDGATWNLDQHLQPSDPDHQDHFGYSLALDGGVLAVGAPYDDTDADSTFDEGSVRVFRDDGASWLEEANLMHDGGADFDIFGWSVDVDGGRIAVGAPFAPVGLNPGQGRVTMYRDNGVGWDQEQVLTPAGAEAGDVNGMTVGISGDVLVMGAPYDDGAGINDDHGSATLYRWDGLAWVQERTYVAADAGFAEWFGMSLAVDDGVLAVGSPGHDELLEPDQGAAWVFDVEPGPWFDEGCALAGGAGDPLLEGLGSLAGDTLNAVELSGAAGSATCALFVALSGGAVPFKGGTLKPFPFFEPVLLSTSPAGGLLLPWTQPVGVPPGTELWVQFAVVDAGAPLGVALSNAIKGLTP